MGTKYGSKQLANAIVLLAFALLANAGIPMPRYEALMKQQSVDLGLYNASDKVTILTETNFKEKVLQQNHSSLVEFYNSYCGHCKRFAPRYKQLADDLIKWREVLDISAIDCAAEENNDICREYEIMSYPSLRYMGPGFSPEAGKYGTPIESQDLDIIRTTMAELIAAENRTANMTKWPNFESVKESTVPALFQGLDKVNQYVVIVYEPENSTVGIETILQYVQWPGINVRRVSDLNTAQKFLIDGKDHRISIVERSRNAIVPYAVNESTLEAYVDVIKDFLRNNHLTERPLTNIENEKLMAEERLNEEMKQNLATIEEVRRNKPTIYQADLEMAVRGILFNEIPKTPDISGERLLALQRLLATLQRYNPLGSRGHDLVSKLYEFVSRFNIELSGQVFEQELESLDQRLGPVFSAHSYVGCLPSRQGLRGFTCSVWTLFHHMTVQAAVAELSENAIEVLQAMHGYVKYFFGCTECSEHFQTMAARRKIWSVPNKDEAVLWLWAAHNEVNQRLAGDATEDPKFPKIQFPNATSCSTCYRQPVMSPANLDISWDKDEVLSYLKNLHSPENINRLNTENFDTSGDKARRKRMANGTFSDFDISVGMAFYGFCFLTMGVVGKLLCFKGYRRKPYSHDLLGKV